MYKKVEKPKENKSRTIASIIGQKKKDTNGGLEFADKSYEENKYSGGQDRNWSGVVQCFKPTLDIKNIDIKHIMTGHGPNSKSKDKDKFDSNDPGVICGYIQTAFDQNKQYLNKYHKTKKLYQNIKKRIGTSPEGYALRKIMICVQVLDNLGDCYVTSAWPYSGPG